MISISGPIRRKRPRQGKSNGVSYLALTDGDVNAFESGVNTLTKGFTDGSDPPTTEVIRGAFNDPVGSGDGITMAVLKGDYWKVTGAGVVTWCPDH